MMNDWSGPDERNPQLFGHSDNRPNRNAFVQSQSDCHRAFSDR